MKKSALILSFHFFPAASVGARRPTELARRLRDEGYQVTAVVSRSSSRGSVDDEDYCRGIRVIYLPLVPSVEDSIFALVARFRGRASKAESPKARTVTSDKDDEEKTESLAKRVQRHFHTFKLIFGNGKAWAFMAFFRVLPLRLQQRFDVVISSGPPMTAHIASTALAKVLGCKLVIDLRDPWISDPTDKRIHNAHWRLRLEKTVRTKCMRKSDLVVCASPGIRRTAVAELPEIKEKSAIALNGYDAMDAPPDAAAEGMLRIIFAGTIYFNRNPLPLFEALQELVGDPATDRSKVRFDLFGDCRFFGDVDLGEWLASHDLDDCVRLNAPVSFAEIQQEIAASNVLLNFAQGQVNQIPAKTFEYLQSGKQTLTITEPDSDTALVIRDAGTGMVVAPDDHAGLRLAVRALYDFFVRDGKRFEPAEIDIRQFSRGAQNDKYLAALNHLLDANDSRN